MKRVVYLLLGLFLFVSSFANNDDYEIIKTDGEYFFDKYQEEKYIESFKAREIISTDSGQIVYGSYSGTEKYTEVWFFSYMAPEASFFGDSLYVDNNGNTTFYNIRNNTINIKKFGFEDDWILFEDNLGYYLTAEYTNKEYLEIIDGTFDSCAIIEINAYDENDNMLGNSYFTGQEIVISKNYGIIQLLYINNFTLIDNYDNINYEPYVYYLNGFNTNSNSIGFQWDYDSYIKSVEIGTEVHYNRFTDEYSRSFRYMVLDKYIENNNQVYELEIIAVEFYNPDEIVDTIYETRTYPLGKLPRETIWASSPHLTDGIDQFLYYTERYSKPALAHRYWWRHSTNMVENHTLWGLRSDTYGGMGTYRPMYFIYELGDFLGSAHWSGDEVVYYKTQSTEWGERLEAFPEPPPPPPPAEIPLSNSGIIFAILGIIALISWRYLKL